ncbi:MAG: translocation/assembly module TamB domain-containing protein [Gammaproteobacteria bacterium]
MIKRIVIAVVMLFILLFAGTIWFTLRSETALHWAVVRVETHYAGKLTIGGVQGSLMGPITLTDVQLDETAFDVRIHTLTLDWQPLALLGRRAVITQFHVQDMGVRIKPRQSSTPFKFVRPQPPHLPVAIIANNLEINHLTLITPELNQPVIVDHATLAAQLDNRAWALRSLQVEGAHVQVKGEGVWAFQRGEQVDAHLQGTLALPGQPAFTGEATAKGDEQTIHFQGSLSAPFQLQLTAELRQVFTAPSWQGELRFSGLDPHRLHPTWPDLLANGDLRVQGGPQATTLTGDIAAREPKYGDWRSHAELRLAGRVLQIHQLNLTRVNTTTRFNLSGEVRYAAGKLEPVLHGDWKALPLPLTGKPWLTSPRGKLEISAKGDEALLTLDGTLANGGNFSGRGEIGLSAPHAWKLRARAQGFQLALASFNKDRPLPPMNWQLQAHGDTVRTLVDRFTAEWLAGRIQAHGSLGHGDGQPWQFDIAAQDINPAALYPQFPGSLNFTARFSGRYATQSAWKFQLIKLAGHLRDAPVQASGTVSHAADVWQFQNVAARLGSNSLQLNGRFGKQPHFTWNLDAPDLAAVWPEIQGKLTSKGEADLSGVVPVLALNLDAEALHFRDYALGKAVAWINMNGSAPTGHATLDAEGAQFKKLKIGSLTAQAGGSLSAHTLTVKFTTPYGDVAITGNGAYDHKLWQGMLTGVTLAPKGAGEWRNTAPWQVRIGVAHFALPQACLGQDAAHICLDADWQPEQWQANGLLTAVPVKSLQALLPEGLDYTGNFGAMLHLKGGSGKHTLDLTASLSPGEIDNVINHHRVTLLAYNAGNLSLHSDTQLTTGQLSWTLKDGGYMDIRSQITHGEQPALSGNIRGEMHDFDLVPALIPEVGGLQGKLDVNLTLSGTPTDPLFSGTASLADGAILIPRLGLHVTGVRLNMNGNGEHLTLDGTAHSGSGSVSWQSSAVRAGNIWQAQGKLSGENFRVSDIPEAWIDVSPNVNFKLDNRDVYVDGAVNVPYAKLRPRDLSKTAQISSDQVIVGENGEPSSEKWHVHAQVRISMGQDVDFSGFGLTGRIIGSVLAVDEPGHNTTGSGALEIADGKFTAYGQKLRIERGRLLFNGGPISNPALDIRAIRPPAHAVTVAPGASEQKVGVIVRGSLEHPKVSLFAEPPLPQSQMLAYLITGQTGVNQSLSPLIGTPPTTASDVTQIAGGQLLASELGQQIGLQGDVSVQNVSLANGTSAPAMFVGRYLSPRLYISYGTGLGQVFNTLRIQYTLSARWMLEAETGFASGADLIYSIER